MSANERNVLIGVLRTAINCAHSHTSSCDRAIDAMEHAVEFLERAEAEETESEPFLLHTDATMAHRHLDVMGVPRHDSHGVVYSLIGRINQACALEYEKDRR